MLVARFELPLANWRILHFSGEELADPEISGGEADPDRDGLKNRYEYLHGSDPRNRSDRGYISSGVRGGWLTMIFQRLQGGGISVVASRDLEVWNIEGLEERILSTQDGVEQVEVRIPSNGYGEGFLQFVYPRSRTP